MEMDISKLKKSIIFEKGGWGEVLFKYLIYS